MKVVLVNRPANIAIGIFKGFSGKVVGDVALDEVEIKLDEHCTVTTVSDNNHPGI